MKLRKGFVSNSSSSSFIISGEGITELQKKMLENHIEYANREWPGEFFADGYDAWTIHINENGDIEGDTMMNNFDIEEFMKRIGICTCRIKWTGY